ncbi:histidine-containing phosphotransfer protein 1-like [Cucurbita pepo subsp. pepo]|uniref:histidine-containing phosphotransfer protein 1-like n=1 Tax=Cucurbita pepo subsp. pepo TaxID=3664 RepID=UPI000C9D90BE|nr:histidine-containing phosphotransfer protein 1-like [Cucurbita pepo subsp. pepo]
MEGVLHLQKQLLDYTLSLFKEGYLNDEFKELQSLQDESNPEFVVEVVSIFFEDSQRLINELAKALDHKCIDFNKVDAYVHQLKGSSSSIGANKVQMACIPFRTSCQDKNIEGCLKCLQHVKEEFASVKDKFETLFKLEQQLLEAHASNPM